MRNYSFIDIRDSVVKYPDHRLQEFKSLRDYLRISEKIIKYYASRLKGMNREKLMMMSRSEDAISEVARHLMWADWRYGRSDTKGRTAYSYRNMCGKWAIIQYLNSCKTKKNKYNASLDTINDETSMYSFLENDTISDPEQKLIETEKFKKIKHKVRFALENSGLSEVQKKCIRYHYLDGIKDYKNVGKVFNPPISRQAVEQNISKGIYKLRQTIKDTN
jgi:hypothetical protein